jgi:hypothetical protein
MFAVGSPDVKSIRDLFFVARSISATPLGAPHKAYADVSPSWLTYVPIKTPN